VCSYIRQLTTELTTPQCHVAQNTDHRIKAVHTLRLGTVWSEHKHMLLIALILPLCVAQPSHQTYSQPQKRGASRSVTYKRKGKTKIAQIVSILISLTETYENIASCFQPFLSRYKFVRTCMANLLNVLRGGGQHR